MNKHRRPSNGRGYAQDAPRPNVSKAISLSLQEWIKSPHTWHARHPKSNILAPTAPAAILAEVEAALVQTFSTCGAGPFLPAGMLFHSAEEMSEGVGAIVIIEGQEKETFEIVFGQMTYEEPESAPDGAGAGSFWIGEHEIKALFAARVHPPTMTIKPKDESEDEVEEPAP